MNKGRHVHKAYSVDRTDRSCVRLPERLPDKALFLYIRGDASGETALHAAPKEQPPRKLSGKRTGPFHAHSEERLDFTIRPPKEQIWHAPDESLRFQHRGGHASKPAVWACTTFEGLNREGIDMTHYAVIGGGITGVTSAYALAKQGHRVTLIEKQRYPGMVTSFANGGQLSACNAEVWNHPATLIKGLKWMFKADAPLLMNPKPSWHKLSWMAEFVAAIPKYAENTITTTRLAIEAREHLYAWAAEEGISFDHQHAGILHIYRDKAGFDRAAKVSSLLAKGGLDRRAVTPSEMVAIEPTLKGQYYGGFFTESDTTGDIHRFTTGLAQACERMGVVILTQTDVVKVAADGHQATVVVRKVDHGRHGVDHPEQALETLSFDAMVICAGVQSRALAAQLGDRLNVYPVKGYSITVNLPDEISQQAAPQVSLLDDATKIVSSRLGKERFRVAGTAEFNGFNLDIRADRIRPLTQWVETCFPGVDTRQSVPWAGLRPMMPNMMPRVGAGKLVNVFYNTGHGHLGWTLSAITAHQLADLVGQREVTGAAAVGRGFTEPGMAR